jgi:hypothetical protein
LCWKGLVPLFFFFSSQLFSWVLEMVL